MTMHLGFHCQLLLPLNTKPCAYAFLGIHGTHRHAFQLTSHHDVALNQQSLRHLVQLELVHRQTRRESDQTTKVALNILDQLLLPERQFHRACAGHQLLTKCHRYQALEYLECVQRVWQLWSSLLCRRNTELQFGHAVQPK